MLHIPCLRRPQLSLSICLVQGPSSINDLVLSEVIAHRNLYHPNIMLLRKVMITETALGIVVEHAAGGNLQDYVRDNSPLQARNLLFSSAMPQGVRLSIVLLIVILHYCRRWMPDPFFNRL